VNGPNRTHALRLLIAWAVLSVVGIVIALQVHMPPGDQSRQGGDESSILQLMLVLSTPVFIGVILFLVYSALVFRQQGKGLVDGPPSYGNLRVQVAWIATTAVVVLYLAGVGIAGLSSAAQATSFTASQLATAGSTPVGASAGHELHVQVIGQQWFFTYRYADYGGIESLHLVLPVDANIEIHVTSTDVLHSFWAYQLGIKADANPGVDNITYVTTMHTGSFTVRCAELCGLWHGHMYDTNGSVVSQSDFATWIAQLQTDESAVPLPTYAPVYFPSPAVKGH
jgi:cytochrome c oxidase subunit 2